MKCLAKDQGELKAYLGAVKKLVNNLNYPESLISELRPGWSELQLLVRGVHRYFSKFHPSGSTEEQQGLEYITKTFSILIEGWLHTTHPPNRLDIQRFCGLASELQLHLERLLMADLQIELEQEQLHKKRA